MQWKQVYAFLRRSERVPSSGALIKSSEQGLTPCPGVAGTAWTLFGNKDCGTVAVRNVTAVALPDAHLVPPCLLLTLPDHLILLLTGFCTHCGDNDHGSCG